MVGRDPAGLTLRLYRRQDMRSTITSPMSIRDGCGTHRGATVPAVAQRPRHSRWPVEPPGRSPMADLTTIASIATDYLGKGKKKKGKKGSKSFIDGLFG